MLSPLVGLGARAQETWTISTVAGANLGDGGAASSAGINAPDGICFDASGNLYFADHYNNRIRKIAPDGTISTFCGGSVVGHNDGTTATAGFGWPANLCFDELGVMYIAEEGTHRVRKVDTDGNVTRVAGFKFPGYSGDNAAAIDAMLNTPTSVAARNGKVYVADTANHCIRLIENGNITTIAGNGTAGFGGDGSAPASALLNNPWFVLLDTDNNLLIADAGNFRVRKIDFAANKITTIAGNGTGGIDSGDNGAPTSASLYDCTGLALDAAGNLYIATRRSIRKVSGNVISTFVAPGADNTEWPQCMAFNAAGELFYTDSQHSRIRKRALDGTITTVAGSAFGNGGLATDAHFSLVSNVTVDASGNVYLADWYDYTVRKINTSGVISVVAGSHLEGSSGNGFDATLARTSDLTDVAIDSSGNLYIADAGNTQIRKVSPAGTMSTLASIPYCAGITVDSTGNVYATGVFSHKVYKITPGGSVSVIAGSSAGYSDGPAGTAKFNRPQGIAVDASGNVFVVDVNNKCVRKISGGVVSTVVSGFSLPRDVAVDSAGNLYIADQFAKKVYKYNATDGLQLIGGTGEYGESGDGGPATSAAMGDPWGLWVNPQGNLLYVVDRGMQRVRKLTRPSAQISLNVTDLTFRTDQGGPNPAAQTFQVGNSGPGGTTLHWTVASDAAWLSVTPDHGDASTDVDTITANVTVGTLTAGTYHGTLTVRDPEASNSPRAIPVTFVVDPPPPFTDIAAPLPAAWFGSVAWGDFDGDGDLDLAIGGENGGYFSALYRNEGNDTFTLLSSGVPQSTEGTLAWGDPDGDGDLDLAYSGYYPYVSGIMRNDAGSFTNSGASLTGLSYSDEVFADFNNDGRQDLFLFGSNLSGKYGFLYRNDGAFNFSDTGTAFTGVRWADLDVGDYDNDGDMDLIVSGSTTDSTAGAITRVYRNEGGGIFQSVSEGFKDQSEFAVKWVDVDNDGDLDAFVKDTLYRNDGGTFTEYSSGLPAVTQGRMIDFADYDNDGDVDAAVMINADPGGLRIYLNDGTGHFSDSGIGGMQGLKTGQVAWGDYDGDGDLDLVVLGATWNNTKYTRIYRNNTTSRNTPPSSPGNLATAVAAQDVTFNWSAATDAETPSAGLTYNLRVGTAPGKNDIVSGMALPSGKRLVPGRGNAQQRLSWTIKNLPNGVYYWSVQAIDTGFAGSPWAGEKAFAVGGPQILTTPASLSFETFAGTNPAPQTVQLGGVENNSYSWSVTDDASWLSVSPATGTWTTGTQPLTVSIDSAGLTVAGSPYTAAITITSPEAGNSPRTIPVTVNIVGDLAGHWKLDETSGTVVADSSGNNNHGTLTSGTWASGVFSGALQLNGSGYVDVPHSTLIDPVNAWTLAAWIKRADTSQHGILEKYNWAAGFGNYAMRIDGSQRLTGYVLSGQSENHVVSTRTLATNKWYHVAVTFDQSTHSLKCYVNGQLEGSITTTVAPLASTTPLRIGARGDDANARMSGLIDDARVYGRALSASEIAALADASPVSIADSYSTAVNQPLNIAAPGVLTNDADPGGDTITAVLNSNVAHGTLALNANGSFTYTPDAGYLGNDSFTYHADDGHGNVSAVTTVTLHMVNVSFTNAGAPLLNVTSSRMSWGDFDNDGDLDLGLCGNFGNDNSTIRTKYYRNDSASFSDVDLGLQVFQEPMLEWGDYNGDGYLDLGVAGWGGGGTGSVIYRGSGSSLTPLYSLNLKGMKAGNGHWEDFDNDGDLDLLIVGESYDDGMSKNAYIYRNNGGDSFTLWQSFTGVRLANCACADYDNDGDIDILISGLESNGVKTRLYRNDGNTFTEVPTPFPDLNSYPAMAWGDYDNDGDLDLILAGLKPDGSRFTGLFRNDNGTFVDTNTAFPVFDAAAAAWGDCDNDGDLDLILFGKVGDSAGEAHLYINDNGTFSEFPIGLPPIYHGDVQWGDYDNDGKLDFVISGRTDEGSTRVSRLYHNTQAMAPNTPPTAPTGLNSGIAGSTVTFAWNAATDDATPSPGLSYNLRVGTAPGKDDIFSGMAASNGWRKVVRIGNAQKRTSWTLKNLPLRRLYWSVQAIDTSYAGGAWAAEQTVDLGPQITISPATLAFTSVANAVPADQTIDLGNAGTGSFSWSVTDDANWLSVSPASGTWTTGTQTLTVSVNPAGLTVGSSPYTATITLTSPEAGTKTVAVTLNVVNANGLIAHWKLDEGAGTTTADSSGNGFNGSLVNSPAWTTGVNNGALQFNGSNSYVNVPTSPDLPSTFSVCAWIWRDAGAGDRKFVDKWNDNTGNFQLSCQVYQDSKLWFGVRQLDDVERVARGTTIIETGRWYHFAGVADAATQKLKVYLNGVEETLQYDPGWNGTIRSVDMELNIGRKTSNWDYWNGKIDDVRIYNRALSQAEIQALIPPSKPVAGNDAYVIAGNTTLNIAASGVLANDSDLNGDAITAVKASDPAQGTLTLNADGSFSYTPPPDFLGNVTFTYTADDGVSGQSAPATVTISVVQDPSLVAHFKLDDGSGLIAADDSGYGNDGTLINGPAWTGSGKIGGALRFDGGDDYVRVARSTALEPDSITVAMWAKITDTRASGISDLLRKAGHGLNGYLLRWSNQNGRLHWYLDFANDPDIAVVDTVPNSTYLNAWHHFAATYDVTTGRARLYVDGAMKGEATGTPGRPLSHTDDLHMMWFPPGSHTAIPGQLDDVRIYNRALTPDEVSKLAFAVVTDTSGNVLDGEFDGTNLPSGDGTAGGDFVSTFTISTPKLKVESLDLTPGSTLTAPPASITATFSKDLDPASVTSSTVTLVRAGSDGIFGTGDDVTLTPASVAVVGTKDVKLDLAGVQIPNGLYRLTFKSGPGVEDLNGNALDGEFSGTFPSGDGTAGGDFVAEFTVAAPLLKVTALSPAPGSTLAAAPITIVASLSAAASNLEPGTITLVGAGDDRLFDTADDVSINAAGVSIINGNQVKLDMNGVTLPPDKYRFTIKSTGGGAHLSFDGANDFVKAPQWLTGTSNQVTWECWIRSTSTRGGMFMIHRAEWNDATFEWGNSVPQTKMSFRLPDDHYLYTDSFDVFGSINQWHHVAGTYDGAQVKFYIDGRLENTMNWTGTVNWDDSFISSFIGGDGHNGWGGFFAGDMSEVRVWDVARTATQIKDNLFRRITGPHAGLVACYPLNEGSGQIANDVSGNGRHATLGSSTAVAAHDPSWTLSGSPFIFCDPFGNALDGEFSGTFPSGDGTAGGDFAAEFKIQPAPVAQPVVISTNEDTAAIGSFDASGATGTSLGYEIVSAPLSGSVTIVPNTNRFIYTPAPDANGVVTFAYKANDGTFDSNVASVTVVINAQNDAPTIVSAAQAVPQSPQVGQNVTFSAFATDVDGDILTYDWTFGDGAQASGASVGHVYITAGVYTAVLTVSDGNGGSVTSSVVVHVQNPNGSGAKPGDSDGDGVPDEMEVAGGTDPLDPNSPIRVAMTVSKASGSMNFTKQNADSCSVSGILPGVPAGFSPKDKVIAFDIGGATAVFTLDTRGKGVSANGQVQLKIKGKRDKATKQIVFGGGDVPFTLKMKGGTWSEGWGVDPGEDASKEPMELSIDVLLSGKLYTATVTSSLTAKAGKGGKFK